MIVLLRLPWGEGDSLMKGVFRTILVRDLTLGLRQRADILMTVFFFVIVASLFIVFRKAVWQ